MSTTPAERCVGLRLDGPDGPVTAGVDLVGGGLQELVVDGVDLVHRYDPARPRPACAGAVLFPWPNRVRDGRWRDGDVERLLPLTDPEHHAANHGLVLDRRFRVRSRADHAVELRVDLEPSPGYPYPLSLLTRYELEPDGLRVEHRVGNRGGAPAPVALGAHPYVRLGAATARDLTVRVAASRWLPVDEQLVPVGDRALADGGPDLAGRLGDRDLHVTLTGLGVVDGRVVHEVAGPGGAVQVWADAAFGHVQLYVCPDLPEPGGGTVRALAVEPMTAAPDALNSGDGLHRLPPGATWTVAWGIRRVR